MLTRKRVRRLLKGAVLSACVAAALIIALNFPYDVDAPLSPAEVSKNIEYYKTAYQTTATEQTAAEDPRYLKIAREAAEEMQIESRVRTFVKTYGLADKKVLEIGSGRGYLQDIVDDYTGLDISPSVRQYYHKNFVLGSANSMPFADSTFDGGWSIWVLEHVPNPEAVLAEIRRVLKPGGVFYLLPAWTCNSWAAEGYGVRPYSDFGLGGKLVKASVPIRDSKLYKAVHRGPNRLMRYASYAALRGPTRLRYIRLEPNYQKYWTNDSDALNSIDRYEAQLWFVSRGDACLNCGGLVRSIPVPAGADPPLIIRVRK